MSVHSALIGQEENWRLRNFASHEDAVHVARFLANRDGVDYGLEKVEGGISSCDVAMHLEESVIGRKLPVATCRIFRLPTPSRRAGYELRCEVVRPDKSTGKYVLVDLGSYQDRINVSPGDLAGEEAIEARRTSYCRERAQLREW